MEKIKKLNTANLILTIISGIASLAFLTMNLLGQWELWHLVGFISYPIVLINALLTLINFQTCRHSAQPEAQKYVRRSRVLMILAVVLTILELFVFSTWFGL